MLQIPQTGVDAGVRGLANCAGVKEDDIGLCVIGREAVTASVQKRADQLGVILINLTAEGLQVDERDGIVRRRAARMDARRGVFAGRWYGQCFSHSKAYRSYWT